MSTWDICKLNVREPWKIKFVKMLGRQLFPSKTFLGRLQDNSRYGPEIFLIVKWPKKPPNVPRSPLYRNLRCFYLTLLLLLCIANVCLAINGRTEKNNILSTWDICKFNVREPSKIKFVKMMCLRFGRQLDAKLELYWQLFRPRRFYDTCKTIPDTVQNPFDCHVAQEASKSAPEPSIPRF